MLHMTKTRSKHTQNNVLFRVQNQGRPQSSCALWARDDRGETDRFFYRVERTKPHEERASPTA